MKVKHLLLSSVLAIPALLLPLASCDDSKSPTEPTVENQAAPELLTAPSRLHDARSQTGQRLRCFDGVSEGTIYGGKCKLFRLRDGGEINAIDDDPDGAYAGVYPSENKIKGKLLTSVHELDFSYAGGPHQGGVPRLSIPIDCVQEVGETVTPYPCATDGTTEHYAFIDAPGCNDGDEFVGTVEGDDNPKCNVNYNSVDYPNWAAFMAAHPGGRIARDAVTFIIADQPAHYIIWKVDIR